MCPAFAFIATDSNNLPAFVKNVVNWFAFRMWHYLLFTVITDDSSHRAEKTDAPSGAADESGTKSLKSLQNLPASKITASRF